MKVTVKKTSGWSGKVVVVPMYAGTTKGEAASIPGKVVPDELGQVATVPDGGKAVCAVMSAGKSDEFDAERMRRIGGAVVNWMRTWKIDAVGVKLPADDKWTGPEMIAALCEGLHLGDFSFDQRKSNNKKKANRRVELLVDNPGRTLSSAAKSAELLCQGANLTRELAHEPPNIINPATLATRVRSIARAAGLKCTVLDDKKLNQLKMGAITAVGQGSKTGSRLIVLEYGMGGAGRGGARSNKKPIVLVGKAVTFDTGGYSLKPRDGMLGMKYDKCGRHGGHRCPEGGGRVEDQAAGGRPDRGRGEHGLRQGLSTRRHHHHHVRQDRADSQRRCRRSAGVVRRPDLRPAQLQTQVRH